MRQAETVMIDIHCHILPGLDVDGPGDREASLAMGAIAAADGVRIIVATPHVQVEWLSADRIATAVDSLNDDFSQAGLPVQVVPGAEIAIHLPVSLFRLHSISATAYVLLEMPHTHFPHSARDKIFKALLAGLRPIVAHAERNGTILRNPSLLGELVTAGALVQVTAGSLTGAFGEEAMDCARYLLKKGFVHFLASDGHSTRRRQPVLSEGLRAAIEIVGVDAARRLVETNPRAILSGEALAS